MSRSRPATASGPTPTPTPPDWRKAGAPGGAGYGTARAMAALYQMMLAGGELNGTRIVSPRLLQYAIRNHTGDRVDEFMGMPMHRGLGPHLRGTTENVRGLGGFASPRAFGHGGVGTSYCWGDPDSGVSFAYITNNRIPDPWHSKRLDQVANLVHTAILGVGARARLERPGSSCALARAGLGTRGARRLPRRRQRKRQRPTGSRRRRSRRSSRAAGRRSRRRRSRPAPCRC